MGKVVVYHELYGCDTGCCGHVIFLDGKPLDFVFSHPYGEDPFEWAKKLIEDRFGKEHTHDLDWENCGVYDG